MKNKVLFVHDGPRWKNSKNIQFGNSSDFDIFERYKYLGENVSFCMRVFKVPDTSNLTNLNEKGLFIHEVVPFNRPSKILNYLKAKKEIIKLVKSTDILIVRLPSTFGSIAYWAAKKYNKPVLVEVVACPHDSLSNHSFIGKIYSRFSVKKLKKIMQDSEYSIYVTNQFLQSRYPTKGKTIAISDVVLKKTFNTNPKLEYYKNYSCNKEIIIGTLAAIDVKYKGHDTVFKAIKQLKERGIPIKYLIAGKGNSNYLKKIATELGIINNVIFEGLLDHSEITDFFDKIDLYIQPSRQEGLPRAVVEAMNFGCACIGSSTGGIPELLNQIAIFKTDNVEELCNKISYFNNNELLIMESNNNFERAKNFSMPFLEEKRNTFYDEFLKSVNEK